MGDTLKFLLELEDKFSSPANKAISSMAKLTETLGEVGGVLGPLIKVEGAMVGLAAAAVIGGAALALHASEAKEDTLNTLDAMMGSHQAALDTYSAIEDLGGKFDISLAKGSELAKQLSAAGVTNKEDLLSAVKAIGEVSSVLGEGAGGKIQKLIEKSQQTGTFKISGKQLTGTGIDEGLLAQRLGVTKKQLEAGKVNAARGIAAVTSLLDEKFGAVAEKKALNIGSQFTRLKDNISKLFEDVDTGPFLEAFSSIVKIFDKSTASGKALKFIVTEFFGGLFKLVAKVAPYVTTFLKGMVIIGLKAFIALKPLGKAFGAIGDQSSGVEKLASFMSKLGDVVGFVVGQIADWVLTGSKVLGWFVDVEGYLVSLPAKFYDAGASMIDGLVNGIKNGGSKVVDSVKDVASSALNKFTSFFEVGSPSKLMMKMGGHLTDGLAMGIAANDNGPQSAMASVVDPTAPLAATGGRGGSSSVTIGPGAIVIQIGGQNAAEIVDQLKQVLPGELASMFESIGLSVGAA